MEKLWSFVLITALLLSMTACSKDVGIKIQDTEMGNLEHQAVDVMGVTYDLFDKGYATIGTILHKEAQLTETVSYEGKEYAVIAIGFARNLSNDDWIQNSVYRDWDFPGDNSPETLTLPESIQYIGTQALRGCTAKQIVLPTQVTMLLGLTFENCINLESITFPDNLNYLSPNGMFGRCYNLKSVKLPAGCEHLSFETLNSTFLDCFALESVSIPGDYKKIGDKVFWNCNELVEVELNEGIETIGTWTFGNCPKLTTLVFPDSVKLIEEQTILNCPNLTDITLPDGLNDVPANMFMNEYSQPADVSNMTIRVESPMVSYVQSIYPTANVVAK